MHKARLPGGASDHSSRVGSLDHGLGVRRSSLTGTYRVLLRRPRTSTVESSSQRSSRQHTNNQRPSRTRAVRCLPRFWEKRNSTPPVGLTSHSAFCSCPHSLQVNEGRSSPFAADTRFDAPHFPHLASMRVSPCFTVTDFFAIASRTSRSFSSRIDCFDIFAT
jgi:hypothetical protein